MPYADFFCSCSCSFYRTVSTLVHIQVTYVSRLPKETTFVLRVKVSYSDANYSYSDPRSGALCLQSSEKQLR